MNFHEAMCKKLLESLGMDEKRMEEYWDNYDNLWEDLDPESFSDEAHEEEEDVE